MPGARLGNGWLPRMLRSLGMTSVEVGAEIKD